MRFPRSVEAAQGIGISKMDLAEALLMEIPPRRGRPRAGTASIDDQLVEVAAEIEAEVGEVYRPDTLRKYRNVAAWVCGNEVGTDPIPWADASWTAHVEAYGKGETFKRFARTPGTKRRVRERNGAATGDVPSAARAINANPAEADKFIENLSDAGMEAVAEAGLIREINKSTGGAAHHRRQPGNPEPRWHQLSRRIELDLIEIRGQINDLRAAGNYAEAEQATTRMRDVLAAAIATYETVPDTIEGLT